MNEREYMIQTFDEDEDVILPNSIISELHLIYCVLIDIYKSPKHQCPKKWMLLRRQIGCFRMWRRVNYGKD